MSQQINLFNPIFRKKGFSFTSSTAMLYGAGIVLAIAALIALYLDHELSLIQREAQAVAAAHSEATANLATLTADLQKQKPNAALEAEIAALDAQLQGRQAIIDTLKSGVVGNTAGFSDYMRAFSRQNVSGLWLTAFDIAGNELAIEGRTLNADLVASYLKQLNKEKSLQGRQFAALRIRQPQADASGADKGVPPKKDQNAKIEPPRFLEFTISTIDIPPGAPAGSKPSSGEAPLLGTISAATVLDPAKPAASQDGPR